MNAVIQTSGFFLKKPSRISLKSPGDNQTASVTN